MARAAKKETSLTTEEKLAKALVPEEEQPYPVPENWCWVRLPAVCRYIRAGGDKPQVISNVKSESHPIPIVANGLQEDGIIGYTNIQSEQAGTLTVSGRGSIGHAVVRDYPYFPVIRLLVIAPNTATYPEYLKYIFDYFEEKGVGTSIPQLTVPTLKKKIIPLPPLPEQQRIVTLIESLFADLDTAKEKLQAVLDGFAERKAALLHQAFTGELTREWREENGVGLESWVRKKIEDFAFTTKLAGFEYTKNIAPNIAKEGIPLFKGKNVQQGQLVLEFESYIPKAVSDELPRSKLSRKCLLTPYVGTIGNVAIFDGSFEAHLGSNVGKIEIQEDTFEEFLLYYLRSDLGYRELTKEKKATAQESISIQAIRNVFVPIPTLPEQKEIVRILDDIFAKESHSRAAVEAALTKIDTMKNAILATAFRGGFGTGDEDDESVVQLLRDTLESH